MKLKNIVVTDRFTISTTTKNPASWRGFAFYHRLNHASTARWNLANIIPRFHLGI